MAGSSSGNLIDFNRRKEFSLSAKVLPENQSRIVSQKNEIRRWSALGNSIA